MDTENLCKFLEPIIQDLGIDIDIFEALKEHEIDGQVFVEMKDEHFEKFLPQLKFGKRMKLMITVKDLSGTEKDDCQISKLDTEAKDDTARKPVGCREFFRTFDSPVGPGDRYKAGNILPVSRYSREDMISPVRMFISMADMKEDIGKVIAVNTVKFAVACLNDRTNGTIYAGVDEENDGEVVGIPNDKSDCEKHVMKLIRKAFYEDQLDIVYQAIRSPKFVQVDQTSGIVKYVVEIDIVPASQLVAEEMFFIKHNVVYGREKSAVAYSFVGGSLKSLDQRETNDFGKKKKSLTQRRQIQEEARRPRENALSDRRQQILNLYGGGIESLQKNIQPILMLSPLSENMNKEYVRENLSFLQHFDSGANFDFEESREKKQLYQYFVEDCEKVFEVLTTDNFEKSSEDFSAERLELLKTTQQKLWIFCNGYKEMDKDALDAFQWKQNRLKGFKEALDVFKIPKSRAIILIFLFSKQYQPLLEASADVLMMFNERWMVLADDKDIANVWMDEMVRRNVASKDVLLSRCVIGMPWKHVNETFKQILKFDLTTECEIPSSTGAFCTVPKKMLNQLTDIEILSRNLFDNDAEMIDSSSREKKRKHAEEMFYRGNPAEWIGFWFGDDYVLKRTGHATLKSRVLKSLTTERNDNDKRVGLTSLLHQPGAGGTTSSRQILWDLRTDYKCCVVRQITDQTADQISTLRDFEEKKQKKPPLVLIDNKDEESIMLLLHKLEKLAKIASWDEHYFPVFCAVLICERRINFPISVEVDKVLLGHELQKAESDFLDKKDKTLFGNYMKYGDVNPKLLISFNMLRTNFDRKYIKEIVSQLVPDLQGNELTVLKYLSLINSYDTFFQQIAISCFDAVTGNTGGGRLCFGLAQQSTWETDLSQSLRLLVNKTTPKKNRGMRVGIIRITSVPLAEEILQYILKEKKTTKSNIMLEMLFSKIFENGDGGTDELLGVVGNLVKKRRVVENVKEHLSPLIQAITNDEGIEKAATVFKEVFKKTRDPMVAQQIGRFYMLYHNWPEAEKYARIATELLPTSSYVFDTLGLVYKNQIYEMISTAKETNTKLSPEDSKKVLILTQEAFGIFRREQELSKRDKALMNNHGGFVNEVKTITTLCDAIPFFQSYPGTAIFHRFLIQQDFWPEKFFVDEEAGKMLKTLDAAVSGAIRRLEEELVQMKSDSRHELNTDRYFNQVVLDDLKQQVYQIFGEDSDQIPESLNENQACKYRRRRVRKMGLTSLQGALSLREMDNGEEQLFRAKNMMKENVNSEFCLPFDLVTILNIIVSLHVCGKTDFVDFEDVLNWSERLFDCEQPEERKYLETYVYLVLFHFPTEARLSAGFPLCSDVKLQDALTRWINTFSKNHPNQNDSIRLGAKKGTTLFFLGKGEGLSEVVYQRDLLLNGREVTTNEYWKSELAKEKFQRLEGTLVQNGKKVKIPLGTQSGNRFVIQISTSKPITDRSMWQKRVNFVFGFSWSEPKAYDIEEGSLEGERNAFRSSGQGNGQEKERMMQHRLELDNKIRVTEERLTDLKAKKQTNKKKREKVRNLQAELEELETQRSKLNK